MQSELMVLPTKRRKKTKYRPYKVHFRVNPEDKAALSLICKKLGVTYTQLISGYLNNVV